MARRKLFDRPVDKEMVERAKQVCREFTVAKRELPILEQDLTRLATKRTEEKNKVMQQLYLEKEKELQKMVDRDKEIITLFTAGEEFLEGTPREVIIQKFLNGKGWNEIETPESSVVKMSNGCVDHYLKIGYQMMGYGIQRYLSIRDKMLGK